MNLKIEKYLYILIKITKDWKKLFCTLTSLWIWQPNRVTFKILYDVNSYLESKKKDKLLNIGLQTNWLCYF